MISKHKRDGKEPTMDPDFQASLSALQARFTSSGQALTHAAALTETVEALQRMKRGFEQTQAQVERNNAKEKRSGRLVEIERELASMGGKPEYGSLPDGFMLDGEWTKKIKYLEESLLCLEQRKTQFVNQQQRGVSAAFGGFSPSGSHGDQYKNEMLEHEARVSSLKNEKLKLLRTCKRMHDQDAYLERKHALLDEEVTLRLEEERP